ncbi:MAG: oxidoreductase [Comamonadaceae bacterium]|nr:MAG: oxidoreductase [Comamonadaceae bacterium]
MTLLEVRIARLEQAATDVVALELVALDGGELPAFEAGAHVDVVVAPGLVRQYSLCGDPAERHRYRLGILREPASRGGSEGVHARFAVGQVIQVGLPRNNFPLVDEAAPALLLAGGIGITPILSMARALHARGVPFALHYCTRSRDRAAFAAELAASPFARSVHFHHDDDPASRFALEDCLADAAPGTHLYVCGPEGFIGFVTAGAAARGWDASRVHVEHFKAAVVQDGEAFTVVAARSGATVQVPAGTTVAEALLAAGVPVMLSCEQGICGTCLVPVLEGVPDHRDQYQTDDEKAGNAHMTPCCSRSLSPRLVLDI